MVITMTKTRTENATVGCGVTARYPSLIVFLILCFSAATFGRLFPPDSWYASLNRPDYAPPNWVFGPVWTVLYLMIAVAGWLVWKSSVSTGKRLTLTMFGIQLLLNAVWSVIFFGWHQPGWALLEIGVLWLTIATTILSFKRHSSPAAVLLFPYLAWVSFAAIFNYGFWSLN